MCCESRLFGGEDVFEVEEGVRAAGDVQQSGHGGDLFKLFPEEPEHELLAQGIIFGPGCGEEFLDVLGGFIFLCQSQGFLDPIWSPRPKVHRTIILAWFSSSNDRRKSI